MGLVAWVLWTVQDKGGDGEREIGKHGICGFISISLADYLERMTWRYLNHTCWLFGRIGMESNNKNEKKNQLRKWNERFCIFIASNALYFTYACGHVACISILPIKTYKIPPPPNYRQLLAENLLVNAMDANMERTDSMYHSLKLHVILPQICRLNFTSHFGLSYTVSSHTYIKQIMAIVEYEWNWCFQDDVRWCLSLNDFPWNFPFPLLCSGL